MYLLPPQHRFAEIYAQLQCNATFNGPPDSFAHHVKDQTLTLVIGRHHARNYSPTGRGTKGYFAYIVGQKRLVFVKLAWRSMSENIYPEHKTYQTLYDHNVPNIPQIITGEDVCHAATREPLRTRTQEFMTSAWKPLERRQYRLVIETLGLPLSEYRDSFALVHATRDSVFGT